MPIFRMSENMASFWIEKKSIKRICTCFSTMKGNEMERIAIYPGSFDPVTNGHLDIMKRASRMVDRLIIGVLNNNSKTPLFSVDERVNMLKEVTRDISNVEIRSFQGLSVNFARQMHAQFILRGLRAITDFDYELQMAQTNRKLFPDIDTIFLTTSLEYAFLSSTTVKEVASYNSDVSLFVPEIVSEKLKEKFCEKRSE